MSRRRNPRRTATALSRNFQEDSEDERSSDSDVDLFQLIQTVLLSSKRRTPKKRTPKKVKQSRVANSGNNKSRGAGKKQPTRAPATVTAAVNLESDCEPIDDVKIDHLKNIENKVNNFFKSGDLLSDDDDELDIIKSKGIQPPKESKKFYSLTDSDDDKPSTSKPTKEEMISPLASNISDKTEITEHSKTNTEDLMEIVDKILDGNEPIEVDAEPDKNWDEYKTKTEEILGSMNAILDEFKENNEKEKPEEKIVEKSPEKLKPTCPICLEVLGGDIVAAATHCGHIFCHECIKTVAKTSKVCPTCRKRMNLKQIHPLYL